MGGRKGVFNIPAGEGGAREQPLASDALEVSADSRGAPSRKRIASFFVLVVFLGPPAGCLPALLRRLCSCSGVSVIQKPSQCSIGQDRVPKFLLVFLFFGRCFLELPVGRGCVLTPLSFCGF